MRISDWSSDVCSSDLEREGRQGDLALQPQPEGRNDAEDPSEVGSVAGGIATGYRGNTRSTLTPAGNSVGDLGQQAGPPARSPRRCSSLTDLRMLVGQGMAPDQQPPRRAGVNALTGNEN